MSASLLAMTSLTFWKTQPVAGVCPMPSPLRCRNHRGQNLGQPKFHSSSARITTSLLILLHQRTQKFPTLNRNLRKYPVLFLFFWLYKQKGGRVITTRLSAGRSPSISPQGQVCCRISTGEGHTKMSEMIQDGFAEGFAQASDTG